VPIRLPTQAETPTPTEPLRSLVRSARPFPGGWPDGQPSPLVVQASYCAAVARRNEVQVVTAPAGVTTFTLTYDGQTTAAITRATADGAAVDAALEALSNIGAGDVTVTGAAGGPWTVTFTGALAETDISELTATTASGTGTVDVDTTAGGLGPSVLPLCDVEVFPAPDAVPDARVWEPYAAHVSARCTTGLWQRQANRDAAVEDLRVDRSRQVAREFWTGERATLESWDNLHLAHMDVTQIASGAATGTISGLGLLEEALAACPGGSMIHATVRTATVWAADGLIETTNTGLRTVAGGTPVVVDAGYPGTGPGNSAPAADHAWAYGTGTVYLLDDSPMLLPDPGDELEVAMAISHRTNTLIWRASQVHLAFWDGCCHLAVNLDLTDRT
jgi:hypothetical protein